MTSLTAQWQALGQPPPSAIPGPRDQAHCALRIAASVAAVLVPPAPDWGHTTFQWDEAKRALVSVPIPGARPFVVAVRLESAAFQIYDGRGTLIMERPFNGLSHADAFGWFTQQAQQLHGAALPRRLEDAEEGLPPPCQADTPIDASNTAAFAELARYYSNADRVLRAVQADQPNASPVRCWPHHSDIAMLITLDPGKDAESARSIGVGMQPGDGSYADPYFYVTPWPYPENAELPTLDGGGAWHTEGWTGAVLVASTIVTDATAPAQGQRVEAFVASAVQGIKQLLGA